MPEEKKKKRAGHKFKFNPAKLFNDRLKGISSDADEQGSLLTRKKPVRLAAKLCHDSNSKSWYIKYVNITPAANTERPMEPIFNVSFNKNGTAGVPKFVELDVEWIGFGDTFMLDQVVYSALQQIRKALKSNLNYTDQDLKACLVNAVALAIYGKILERDIHWNLYNGSDDFNFAKMYKYQNQVINTYGLVTLYPKDYLLDENLPTSSVLYNKIASLFNQVIKLPSRIGEFISHYFGTLFTLDKDGHNDQYLKINMHEIDYFTDGDPNQPATLDLSRISLDEYMDLLNSYSKRFAVILADLEKCLGVVNTKIQRYEEFTYAFVYDKSLLQALINGYTDRSAVVNNFIRLDRMPDVDDDLTQFIFMGGVQPDDESKSNVRAIRILDMVLKCNSDTTINWPEVLTQAQISDDLEQVIKQDVPFGLAITTNVTADDDINASVATASEISRMNIPTLPSKLPANGDLDDFILTYGASVKTTYPANDYRINVGVGNQSNAHLISMIYLGSIIYEGNDTTLAADYIFAYATTAVLGTALGVWKEFEKGVCMHCQLPYSEGAKLKFMELDRSIRNESDPAAWFFWSDDRDESVLNRTMNKIAENWVKFYQYLDESIGFDFASHPANNVIGAYFVSYGTARYDCHVTVFRNSEGSQYNYSVTWTATNEMCYASTFRASLISASDMAPAGITALRYWSVSVSVSALSGTIAGAAGGEGLPMYVSQVIDYHIPMYYTRRYHYGLFGNDTLLSEIQGTSLPVLIKEDYIPYYYNILDLIPVLYEMFVSLFSIDNIRKSDRFTKK